jgi:hypothetical protein
MIKPSTFAKIKAPKARMKIARHAAQQVPGTKKKQNKSRQGRLMISFAIGPSALSFIHRD